VRELTPQDFEDLFTLRLILEPPGAKLAATRLGEEQSALEENIRATQKADTIEEVTRLDLEFHELILTASRSARLLRMWYSIKNELGLWLSQLHREHSHQKLNTREATATSHLQILAAFRTQTPATCERIMREHILGWREWLPLQAPTA
jgi:DNA-binding GntR family transcriptional regulator